MATRSIQPILIALALILGSCSATQPLAQFDDDVYYMPSQAKAAPARPVEEPQAQQAPAESETSDDYYDPAASRESGAQRGYYDMAYNDPHFYNYGRFGFGMGWQNGWNGPGWGMGMGWGNGGWNNGWGNAGWGMNDPWNQPWGWNSWNQPWGWNSWNQPWGWNDPWGYQSGWGGPMNGWGYNGWNNYGYGSYWGPYGPCRTCYVPIVIGSGNGTYVGHRSPTNRSSSAGTGNLGPRVTRNPVSLAPRPSRNEPDRGFAEPEKPVLRPVAPATAPGQQREPRPIDRVNERRPATAPSRERQPMRSIDPPMERAAPAPSRDGGGSSPSRHRSR